MLTESTEERNLRAADYVLREGIAEIMFIGSEDEVKKAAKELKLNISKAVIIDPKRSKKFDEYSSKFYELRKHKGITEEQARELMHDRMYFGTMAVKVGDANGLVSGAVHKGAYETLRPALQIIKTKPYLSTVSGGFLMCLPTKEYGEDGVMVFADCAVVPEPNAEQLADIAIASAETFSSLVGKTPKVAMLSFSTKGSGAENPVVHKIIEATKIALSKRPELMLDGELQADAAIVPWIGERKAPGSKVAGHANVLVFP
ncbi:MAG: phosphate acyltransferase, partial [Thermoplasmata archaeon]